MCVSVCLFTKWIQIQSAKGHYQMVIFYQMATFLPNGSKSSLPNDITKWSFFTKWFTKWSAHLVIMSPIW